MSAGDATAADVPGKYDLVINGKGYILSNTVDQSLPFRVQRAAYSWSPTFVERQNVSGDFGDNQQDFWLTYTQRDWSLGEQQKFYRQSDSESTRKYWRGTNVDVRVPGQVSIRPGVRTLTYAAAVRATAGYVALSSTNLYYVSSTGSISDAGAHGLGTNPTRWAIAIDPWNGYYFSSTAGGTVGVRFWGGAFSTFSASAQDSLEYLNNTLYGAGNTGFGSFSSAGVFSTIYQWKAPNGGAFAPETVLRAYGSKLLILIHTDNLGGELWIYDGVGTTKIAKLPTTFITHDMRVAQGIVFISGATYQSDGSTYGLRIPTIFFYLNGTLGKLWQATESVAAAAATTGYAGPFPAMGDFENGLLFTDDTTGRLMFYNITEGGIHCVGSYTVAGDTPLMGIYNPQGTVLMTRNQTTAYLYPDSSTYATTATITSSLDDFDSSLDKTFRGIKVDFLSGTDGNGGSVDIAYRVGDVDGSYTTLQTGATSGTEYPLTGISGRGISVKVTLNKGTSTTGPVLKRIAVRAAPVLQQFAMGEYILDLTGRNGRSHVRLRNGTDHPLDGLAMANNLRSAIMSTSPITVIDRFQTSTAVMDPGGSEIIELRPEEFIARVRMRQV